jgi:GNAT superfamily N-acetyltransferase
MRYFKFFEEWKQINYPTDIYQNRKEITINGVVYTFGQSNLWGEKNKFIIELNGEEIGFAILNKDNYLDNIRIEPKYKRIGLATHLYEYIEDVCKIKLKPSPIKQSKEIREFWKKRN